MTIQLITHPSSIPEFSGITCSSLGSPRSLDEFDVNIIDLSSSNIWRNETNSVRSVDIINDFQTLQTMVNQKDKSRIIFVLPTNLEFKCFSYIDGGKTKYKKKFLLKDIMTEICKNVLIKLIPSLVMLNDIVYENTRTLVKGKEFEADFYFLSLKEKEGVTKSERSEKNTTIVVETDSIYATTLQITKSQEDIIHFVSTVLFPKTVEEAPEWIHSIEFSDDAEQKVIIKECNDEIAEAQRKIADANECLKQSARYKSILYTNGTELVEVVFSILEQLLNCDLSGFIDERKEDFCIKKEQVTFLGEIKGVNSNVKNEHISQVDVHYQRYMDELNEEGKNENVRQILIINPFRTKPVNDREPINEQQVGLAKRNNCLIVETKTLLDVFGMFLSGQLLPEKCIDVFSQETGLLSIEVFFNKCSAQ